MPRVVAWLVVVGAVLTACGAPAPPRVSDARASFPTTAGGTRLVVVAVESSGMGTYLALVRESKTGTCVLLHVSDRAYAAYSSQTVMPKEACE